MRLFLAIELPVEIKEKIEKAILSLKREYPQFSWVDKENFHITLYFYGEISRPEKIVKRLKERLYQQPSFYLYFRSGDLFLNQKITLYLNFLREKKLESLVEQIKSPSHIKNKQKFIPHLTIARAKKSSKQQYLHLKKKLEKINLELSFLVNKITLFQSILTGKKPVYKEIVQIPLISQ